MTLRSLLAASAATFATAATCGVYAGSAYAQETVAAVRGGVTDEAGAPVAGARVTVTDTRTGQSRTVTTGDEGAFRVGNLSVGGPYTVVARAPGLQGEQVDGLTLTVGDAANLSFELAPSTTDEIVVVGRRQVLGQIAPGPSVTFTAEDIAALPATSRDIKDIIQVDPRIYIDETNGDGIFCVGSSNRSNSLTIDGYGVNDAFGLNSNGYPTQRLPFPFDITEQVTVEIAPFDVEYGNFTGCNVNVVTRSGGNEFTGRLAFDYLGEDLVGDSLEGEEISLLTTSREAYAGFLTGPIVPDRLFFAAGVEITRDQDVSDGLQFDGDSVNGIALADIDRVTAIAENVYGFQAGELANAFDVEDERYFVKLNGFITDQHRFEASVQHTDGNNVNPQNTGRDRVGLSSNYYLRTEELTAYSGRLFSDWTDALSTEVRVSYQDRKTGQDSLGDLDFAQVEVLTNEGDSSIFLGPDQFRHANRLEQEVFNAKVKADYAIGDHLLTVGYEYDQIDVFNLFVFASQGSAEYGSIDAFEDQTPDNLFYRNAQSNDAEDAAASFQNRVHTGYVQDVWTVNPDLVVTGGVRVDSYDVSDTPAFNPLFQNRYGIRNDDTLDAKSIIQPRISFDWQASDALTVTGGVGRFSGGNPFVWVSNSYSNSGNLIGSVFETDADVIGGFDGFNIPGAILDANAESAAEGTGFVDALSPDFEIPSITRFSLGAQLDADLGRLGEGWVFGADLLYGITHDPAEWRALNLRRVGTAADGRPIYRNQDLLDPDCPAANARADEGAADGDCSTRGNGSNADILLTNSEEEPTQLVLSAYADKSFEFQSGAGLTGIDLRLGYAYTDAEDVNPGTSSRAISNYENFATANYNFSRPATSNYEIAHRFTARVDLDQEWREGWGTRLTLFGQVNSGQPFSYTYDNGGSSSADGIPGSAQNPFGDHDPSEDRDLVYVPNSIGDPVFSPDQTNPDAFAAYIDFFSDDAFDAYRGEIAPRNAFTSDWWGQVDLRLQQEVPLPSTLGNDRLRFIVDIDNFTNLLNDEWGVRRSVPFAFNQPVARVSLDDQNRLVVEDFGERDQFVQISQSVWEIQLGARYDF